MNIQIITPEKTLFTGEIKLVQVPGTKGNFQVLKDHAPLISTLENGQIKLVELNGIEKYFDISSGVIEVMKNEIIILAEM